MGESGVGWTADRVGPRQLIHNAWVIRKVEDV